MTIAPEALAWLHQSATVKGSTYSQVLLHLLERVEALEQRPIPGVVELAAPAPTPPSPEMGEVGELAAELHRIACYLDSNDPVRATLAAAATLLQQPPAPAPVAVPVPVSERLPGEGDCDAEGRCWLFSKVESEWRLLNVANPGVPHLKYCFSHWLPAHAIPLPQAPLSPPL